MDALTQKLQEIGAVEEAKNAALAALQANKHILKDKITDAENAITSATDSSSNPKYKGANEGKINDLAKDLQTVITKANTVANKSEPTTGIIDDINNLKKETTDVNNNELENALKSFENGVNALPDGSGNSGKSVTDIIGTFNEDYFKGIFGVKPLSPYKITDDKAKEILTNISNEKVEDDLQNLENVTSVKDKEKDKVEDTF